MASKWEYLVKRLCNGTVIDDQRMQKTLNELGEQGWELVSVDGYNHGYKAFFKRPARDNMLTRGDTPNVDEPTPVKQQTTW